MLPYVAAFKSRICMVVNISRRSATKPLNHYSGVTQIRKLFSFSLLFSKNKLLFCPLFSQELSVSVSYHVVPYFQSSPVFCIGLPIFMTALKVLQTL